MIAIPNMEKPKECGDCNFVQAFWDDKRWLFRCLVTDKIAEDCPLIEIDLVRCGECKWWDKDGKRKDGKGWCENVICGLTEPNAFCSYGERRADE